MKSDLIYNHNLLLPLKCLLYPPPLPPHHPIPHLPSLPPPPKKKNNNKIKTPIHFSTPSTKKTKKNYPKNI